MTTDLPVADRLGVCHCAGRYSIGPEPQLLAGANRILELGSRVIKLWFRNPLGHFYPAQPDLPAVSSLREMAELPEMREIFDLPFTTIVLSADGTNAQEIGWGRPIGDDDLRKEADQLEELTEHLVGTYGDTGKTFVLQNWEGDWAAKGGFDKSKPTDPASLDLMVRRLRIRQEAVERGRRGTQVVLHAPEVNLVLPESQAGQSVTEAVLPHVGCDLYSYSAWEASLNDGGDRFVEALERIRDAAGCRNDQVILGEFGAPEQGFDPDQHVSLVQRTIDEGLAFGCSLLLYWTLCCNEVRPVAVPTDPFPDQPGFWLLRPDGSKAPHWQVMADALARG